MKILESLFKKKPPEHLYHYTSIMGLWGILTDRSLRASVINYLNDSQEFKYAVMILNKMLTKRIEELPPRRAIIPSGSDPTIEELLYELYTTMAQFIGDPRICVFSLSEHGDLLSQWRGYCPPEGGYSLGFRSDYFLPFLRDQKLRLAPCVYNIDDQESLVADAIEEVVKIFMIRYQEGKTDLRNLIKMVLSDFSKQFFTIASLVKHPSFYEESEWRVISESKKVSELEYRVGKSMLIPYSSIYFKDFSPFSGAEARPFPIDEIVIGPTFYQKLALGSLAGFLFGHDIPIQWVKPSSIPYRKL